MNNKIGIIISIIIVLSYMLISQTIIKQGKILINEFHNNTSIESIVNNNLK